MNIQRTNPLGIRLIDNRFNSLKDVKNTFINNKIERAKINNQNAQEFTDKHKYISMVRMNVFDFNEKQKVFKLTKNIVKNCKLINIESIKENINIQDFKFESLVILLENDNSGLIKIDRTGADFDFLYLKNLNNLENVYFDTYSFLTKEFNFNDGDENSIFVVQLLAYLYYGEITTKIIKPKENVKLSPFSKFINNSNLKITYVDSLWKQRISVGGFKVRGHFRLQPIGVNRIKRKLIWIEEFNKDGYNRKATRELENNN